MYGSIFRMRPKAGRAADVAALFQNWGETRGRVVEGLRAGYVLAPTSHPGDLIGVAVFKDPETYEANANSPEQHQWYLGIRELLEADPEWQDGEYVTAGSGNPDAVRVIAANFAAFDAHDLDAGACMLAPDAELQDTATGLDLVGPAGLRQYWEGWFSGFPDGRTEILKIAAADDGTVVTEFLGKGTHTGPLPGPGGRVILATGRSTCTRFCQVATVKENLITGARMYYDLVGFLAQLGIMGSPG
ncbi:MAG TPA: nuclear transport factor 2 family protein [Chloroflexota bacterium]|nr:nuclear transport factor 2 family protein [Chloroflexota bacterium]